MNKTPLPAKDGIEDDLYKTKPDIQLMRYNDCRDSSEVKEKTDELKNLIKMLMENEEQNGKAFLLFFASRNDLRDYNALPKHDFYANIASYNLSTNDFDFDSISEDETIYKGVIYDEIEKQKSTHGHKRINILLSGNGGHLGAITCFYKYLRNIFNEIHVYVYENVGSALAMFALSADGFHVKDGSKYIVNETASISKLDVQIPYWRKNSNVNCLKYDFIHQVPLEKLLAAFDDNDAYKKYAKDVGHEYLYNHPLRKYWKTEYEMLVDALKEEKAGEDVFDFFCRSFLNKNNTNENIIEAMYQTYQYFGNEIRKIRKNVKVEALTAPTFDLLAACGLGKAIYHHGSHLHTYDFDKLGIDNYETIPPTTACENEEKKGFFSLLGEINEKCKELVYLDDIKKVFVFNSSDVLICTEDRESSVTSVSDYFKKVISLNEKLNQNRKSNSTPPEKDAPITNEGKGIKYPLGFRGQTIDHGSLSSSVFRKGQLEQEDIRYEQCLDNCADSFARADTDERIKNVSYSVPMNICKQQHYGIPTRFLDFSFCPLIALYFACSDRELEFGRACKTISSTELEDGVVYVVYISEREYDNLYHEQKALAYSNLVKLNINDKNLLINKLTDYKRYLSLLKRYLDYVYRVAYLCSDENFLHKDFGSLYGSLYKDQFDSPYIDSLRILRKKARANSIDAEIVDIISELIKTMKVFVSYTDVEYKKNRALLLLFLTGYYSDIQPMFFLELVKKKEHRDILEKIFGKFQVVLDDEAKTRDFYYSDLIFSLDKEILFEPDYSISANARLKRQKGLFLISGLQEQIATSRYHKLIIKKDAKREILDQLRNKKGFENEHLCPLKETECTFCSCENGFTFENVYGDLYGQGKAIDLQRCTDNGNDVLC